MGKKGETSLAPGEVGESSLEQNSSCFVQIFTRLGVPGTGLARQQAHSGN